MALKERDEYKSINASYQNEAGEDVFHASSSYGKRSISLSFDMFNSDYCIEHKTEVQASISAFIGRLNTLLSENNLPIIQA